MKLTFSIYILAFLAASNQLIAQTKKSNVRNHAVAKTTVASLDEDLYDVKYVKMDLQATNLSTVLSGHVTNYARVVAASMGEYVFELAPQFAIDSARIGGQTLPVSRNGFVCTITLSSPLSQNASFKADIYYHGQATGASGFFTDGLLHDVDASIPAAVTHTVSAAYHSRDWWPCKQSLTDKIDSADIRVTVPTGLMVAGNGLLKSVTPVAGGNRYEWSTRYPTDYYLLSFAVAPYNEYNYYMHFVGSSDSMLVQNYIYNVPQILQDHQDELDSIGVIINYFSELFGRYPFYKEKIGICQAPLGGGMENQTMVTLGDLTTTLIAHELSHQWWGDHVTCGSLHDMWLNEGMATYCEQLFMERFQPLQLQSYRSSFFNQAMSGTGGSVYVDDTTDELRIYSNRLTYAKGGALAHMLRFVVNNDSLYFAMLKQYQQQYAFGTATSSDMQQLAEQVLNIDLDTFFDQWLYKEGFPIYAAKWHQNSNQEVFVKLTQTTSVPNSVALFKTPLEIGLHSASGDTVIRVYNDQQVQDYSFTWGRTMTALTIDPRNNILNKTGFITHDPTLSVAAAELKQVEIFPNPSSGGWNIRNLPIGARLLLSDIAGKMVWQGTTATDNLQIPSSNLDTGSYILTVTAKTGKSMSYQLRK